MIIHNNNNDDNNNDLGHFCAYRSLLGIMYIMI